MEKMGRGGGFALLWAVGAALALAVYARTLGGGPVWDDVLFFRAWESEGRAFPGFFASVWEAVSSKVPLEIAKYWRPAGSLTLALVDASGAPFWAMRATSIALFSLVAAFAGLAAAGLCKRMGIEGFPALAGGVLAAALVAVHPANAETAAWVSGRFDLQVGLGFAALCAISTSALSGTRWRVLFLAAFLFSVLSKDSGFVYAAAVLAALWFDEKRPKEDRVFALMGGLAAIAAFVALRHAVLGSSGFYPREVPLAESLALSQGALRVYWGVLFAPWSGVSVIHPVDEAGGWLGLVAALALLALTALCLARAFAARAVQRPLWVFGFALSCALAFFGLVSGFARVADGVLAADRYVAALTVAQGVGAGAVFAVALRRRGGNAKDRLAAVFAAAAAVFVLGVSASGHATAWGSEVGFWTRAEGAHPDGMMEKAGLANALLAKGRVGEALEAAKRGEDLMGRLGWIGGGRGVSLVFLKAVVLSRVLGMDEALAYVWGIDGFAERNPGFLGSPQVRLEWETSREFFSGVFNAQAKRCERAMVHANNWRALTGQNKGASVSHAERGGGFAAAIAACSEIYKGAGALPAP